MMIKRFAKNYGRRVVALFATHITSGSVLLDLGAEGGDLQIARKQFPHAIFWAVESYPPYADELTNLGINVCSLNI